MRRKSDQFFIGLAVLLLLLLLAFVDISIRGDSSQARLDTMTSQVQSLELTDLCLFTEARYTRHLSQSDWHTAFQDHPLALEHFPSGSLLVPPEVVKK